MNLDQSLIWLVVLLAGIFLLAFISIPSKNMAKKILLVFVLNFVCHFVNIFYSEFAKNITEIELNPVFFANYGPLLWLYFKSFHNSGFRFRLPYLFLFIPSIFMLVWGSTRDFEYNDVLMITISLLVVNSVYVFLCVKVYNGKPQKYASIERKWLASLLLFFTLLLLASIANLIFSFFQLQTLQSLVTTIIFIIAVVFIASFIYFAIVFPELFKNLKERYYGSGLSNKESLKLALRIAAFLKDGERFLEPDLSLSSLASALDVSSKNISQAINQHLEGNFYDYMNRLRTDKAISMLYDPKNDGLPVKSIMYDCGFNNKMTFNRAFKNRTGKTPSEFRDQRSTKKK